MPNDRQHIDELRKQAEALREKSVSLRLRSADLMQWSAIATYQLASAIKKFRDPRVR